MRIAILEHIKASLGGYFWLPCPNCGRMFGGHEYGGGELYASNPEDITDKIRESNPPSVKGQIIFASVQRGQMTCNDPKCLAEVERKNGEVDGH